jgi:hypothetical protein
MIFYTIATGEPRRLPEPPPRWVLVPAAIGGGVVNLLYLGSTDFRQVPGCRDIGPGQTLAQGSTLEEGYPVTFLATHPCGR